MPAHASRTLAPAPSAPPSRVERRLLAPVRPRPPGGAPHPPNSPPARQPAPSSFDRWIRAKLESLDLSFNQLTGSIPAALGDLSNLHTLDLAGNQLTGPIPAALGDLSNLHTLDLAGNQLTGPIPAWLGDLGNLQTLDLGATS